MTNSERIKQKAVELGFLACGIAKAQKLEAEEERLQNYLNLNYNGKMAYMSNHFDKRLDPTLLVPGAKSVVVVLLNYFPAKLQTGKGAPVISKYAYGDDYHLILKDKLQQLYQFIQVEIAPVTGRVFTDSAPVLERAWAVQAGLGWIGKNGLLINQKFGSFFFIGELIIDLELEYDHPYEKEHCGSCNQCLSACPTNAFVSPAVLDARKCISYLTIELHDEIPSEFVPKLTKRAFGCDICQDVCPWNRRPEPSIHFEANSFILSVSKDDWLALDSDIFDDLFKKSAIKRAGFQKLIQNIRLAVSG